MNFALRITIAEIETNCLPHRNNLKSIIFITESFFCMFSEIAVFRLRFLVSFSGLCLPFDDSYCLRVLIISHFLKVVDMQTARFILCCLVVAGQKLTWYNFYFWIEWPHTLCQDEYLHGWIENPIFVYTYLKFTSTFVPEKFKNGIKFFALI